MCEILNGYLRDFCAAHIKNSITADDVFIYGLISKQVTRKFVNERPLDVKYFSPAF